MPLSNPFGGESPVTPPHQILRQLEEEAQALEDDINAIEEKEKAEILAERKVRERRQTITDHLREAHFGNFPNRHPEINQDNENKLSDLVDYLLDEKGVETTEEASSLFRNLIQQARTRGMVQNHPLLDQAWAIIKSGRVI